MVSVGSDIFLLAVSVFIITGGLLFPGLFREQIWKYNFFSLFLKNKMYDGLLSDTSNSNFFTYYFNPIFLSSISVSFSHVSNPIFK